MSLSIENNFLVQKYKLAFEEHEITKQKCKEGLRDLEAHMHILQDRLSENIKNQKEKFQKNFFEPAEEADNITEVEAEKPIKPSWAKKAFREIVMSTHPDKTSFLSVPSVKEKFKKYYNLSVESYNDGAFENLIFIASDLGIEIDDSVVKETVQPKLVALISEIERMKKTDAFRWTAVKEEEKYKVLERYLKNLGYVFKKETINDAMNEAKRIKRKKGTRPVNYIKKRIK